MPKHNRSTLREYSIVDADNYDFPEFDGTADECIDFLFERTGFKYTDGGFRCLVYNNKKSNGKYGSVKGIKGERFQVYDIGKIGLNDI